MRRPEWMRQAACRGMDVNWFFPKNHNSKQIGETRTVCGRCPVRDECYAHALKHEEHGMWAGTTGKDREAARKRHGIELDRLERHWEHALAPCGTRSGWYRHERHRESPCGPCSDAMHRWKYPQGEATRRGRAS